MRAAGSLSFRRIVALFLVAYAGYALLIFLVQRTFIYPGVKLPAATVPLAGGIRPEIISFTGGGKGLLFVDRPAVSRRQPALLVFHGNNELAVDLLHHFTSVLQRGVALMLVEYPGYGGVPGSPTEMSLTGAALAAYDYLAGRDDIDSARITAFGRSLGGGVACALARKRQLRGLVLQSTFTSLRPFSTRYLVPGFLARDVYDNKKALRSLRIPVLLLHGTEDRVVPFDHGRQLADAAANARLVPFRAGHSDIMDLYGFWDEVYRYVLACSGIDEMPVQRKP